MNEKEVLEAHKEAIKKLGYCTDRVTDMLCVLRIAMIMLAQKTGVDSIELMKDAQRVYDVERLNRKMDDQ